MRLRIDGPKDLGVAQEARLALRHEGFILVEGDADYVVRLEEREPADDVVVSGSDGTLERDVINRLAPAVSSVVLIRQRPVNDRTIGIAIPPDDGLRRTVSRALVEIFVTYVNRSPALPPALVVGSTANGLGTTVDRLVAHLCDMERAHRAAVQAWHRPWWQRLWRSRG
jgi:hypothetical protein